MDDEDEIDRLDKIAQANGISHSTWCVDGVSDFDAPHPYVAVKNVFFQRYDKRAPLAGDRWIDLWRTCDDLIGQCGLIDHSFIEDFVQTPGSDEVVLWCGS